MKKSYSLFCFLFLVQSWVCFEYYPKWKTASTEAAISWDASGYYMYLPAVFIYKDIKQLKFGPEIIKKYRPSPSFQQAFDHHSGNKVLKYSMGQAVLYAPGFLVSHVFTKYFTELPADGFSKYYQLGLVIWSLMIAWIGMVMFFCLIRYLYDQKTAIVCLSILVLATNYLEYTTSWGVLTHSYLFTIMAALVWSTIKFNKAPSFKLAFLIGVLVGLAGLTRPTELLMVLIPLFWPLYHKKEIGFVQSLKAKVEFLALNKAKILLAILVCGFIGSLQLFYWKYVSGDWIVYSYEDQGFDFLRPHLYNGLFSANNGWLCYTPIMSLMFFGFYALYKRKKTLFPFVLLYCLFYLYITYSWSIWWYGGRAMIQGYPILFISVAAIVQFFMEGKKWKYFLVGIISIAIYYNVWVTHNYHRGALIKVDQMSSRYYRKVVGRWNPSIETLKLLDTRNINEKPLVEPIRIQTTSKFEQDSLGKFIALEIPTKSIDVVCDRLNKGQFNTDWVRVYFDLKSKTKEWDVWKMHSAGIRFLDENKEPVYKSFIRIHRFVNQGERKIIYLDSKVPKEFHTAEVFVKNPGSNKELKIFNSFIELYNQ